MTIAIKIGDEDSPIKGTIYLDAVTLYTHSMSGKVTSHPVDSGGVISDHFISENQKFSIEGVLSNVDLGGLSSQVDLEGEGVINAKPKGNAPTLSAPASTLSFLPTAVKQFFDKTEAGVDGVEGQAQDYTLAIKALLEELMTGVYYSEAAKRWKNKMVLSTLYEMEGLNFTRAIKDLVITSYSSREDPDSGDALFVSLDLEKVRFVTIEQTEMPKKAAPAKKKTVAKAADKGKPNCPTGKENTASTPKPSSQAPSSGKPLHDKTENYNKDLAKAREEAAKL